MTKAKLNNNNNNNIIIIIIKKVSTSSSSVDNISAVLQTLYMRWNSSTQTTPQTGPKRNQNGAGPLTNFTSPGRKKFMGKEVGFKLGSERRERVTEAQVWRKVVPDSRCTERERTMPNGRLNTGNCTKTLIDGTKTPRRCVRMNKIG